MAGVVLCDVALAASVLLGSGSRGVHGSLCGCMGRLWVRACCAAQRGLGKCARGGLPGQLVDLAMRLLEKAMPKNAPWELLGSAVDTHAVHALVEVSKCGLIAGMCGACSIGIVV